MKQHSDGVFNAALTFLEVWVWMDEEWMDRLVMQIQSDKVNNDVNLRTGELNSITEML